MILVLAKLLGAVVVAGLMILAACFIVALLWRTL